ncbi:amidohydrolase family protein [Longibacter sp.]|uniref:amidohydrolase family protein n=1 Tax=Longibacter sp. TaxID=2045415 RepID=UPI003EB71BC7
MPLSLRRLLPVFLALILAGLPAATRAQETPPAAPDRTEGDGPYERLVLRGATLIDGTGAPPIGPVDIVVEGDRITRIESVGYPGVPIDESDRPAAGDREIDLSGMYILPGFIDMHGHLGGVSQGTTAEYVLKLWMGHGITTVREPGSFNGMEWTFRHRERSAANEIVAPRIIAYVGFGMGQDQTPSTPDAARSWVRSVKERGADGIKFFGASPDVMKAALDEANEQSLGTAMHHAQLNVTRVNSLTSASWGLTTMEHWYGLPEALFTDRMIQDYPADYNYNNEQHRFGEAGRLWQQAATPGSEHWNTVMDSLITLDFTMVPTLTIYEASRDLMRARNAPWHDDYTLPSLWDFFEPSREAHGSYWFHWTTRHEIDWKENYRLWMTFLNEYKNRGGRVVTGSDSGYIYKLYGFGYVRELELLQEAGFHPLEVIQAATLNGAEALGMEGEIGSIEVGKKADFVVVEENPIENLKVLYGIGALKLDDETEEPTRVGGVRYTIKDGIVYDAPALLEDVRQLVDDAQAAD